MTAAVPSRTPFPDEEAGASQSHGFWNTSTAPKPVHETRSRNPLRGRGDASIGRFLDAVLETLSGFARTEDETRGQ